MPADNLAVLCFESAAEWEAWLSAHHSSSPGAWLKIGKKGASTPTVSYPEALDVALCFGWIDGQKGRLDDSYWLQRFTRRKPSSKWSKINTAKAADLIRDGRMREAGMRAVEQAKRDGRWDAAYAGQATMQVPADLQRELDSNEAARAFFATISSVNRYAVLYRIEAAKRPETRARRIAAFVAMLADGKTLHP